MAASCWQLFFHLGHYPFWCDEAITALYARGVARTGDTYAILDENLFAYAKGAELVDLRGRYEAPAPFYLAAPFVGREGTDTFWPRFPFAVCGLLSVGFILYWLWRDHAPPLLWSLMTLGIVGNVSLFLFLRQCRYYGLATLLSLAAAYCYLHWNGRRRAVVCFSALAILLLLTHFLAYAGLMACIAVDYAFDGRHRQRLTYGDWAVVLISQFVFGVLIISVWNPLNKDVVAHVPPGNLLIDHLTLFWWNLRDMNACEYYAGPLMLLAPVVCLLNKDWLLLRVAVAILVFAAVVAVLAPHPLALMTFADVRFLSSMIPLCILAICLLIQSIARGRWAIALPIAIVAFGTNVLHHPWDPSSWRSTCYEWAHELVSGRTTSTQLAIDWINNKVKPGESIWVTPDYMTYPLMYHCPQAIYAWQLTPPPHEGQFKDLPKIHFRGLTAPDYLLEFGHWDEVEKVITTYEGDLKLRYELADTIDVYWVDLTRPELVLHGFKPVSQYNPNIDAIYVWRRDGVTAR